MRVRPLTVVTITNHGKSVVRLTYVAGRTRYMAALAAGATVRLRARGAVTVGEPAPCV